VSRNSIFRPESFAIREHNLRSALILQRFPYHFLFRVVGDLVRILVVRPSQKTSHWSASGADDIAQRLTDSPTNIHLHAFGIP
jgi:hypothetical protein